MSKPVQQSQKSKSFGDKLLPVKALGFLQPLVGPAGIGLGSVIDAQKHSDVWTVWFNPRSRYFLIQFHKGNTEEKACIPMERVSWWQ